MTGTVAAIVVAAGRGERAGGDVPKQYRNIAGEPMIRPTLRAFLNHALIGIVQPVINASDEQLYRAATAGLEKLPAPVPGGATRQASVRAGLEALARARARIWSSFMTRHGRFSAALWSIAPLPRASRPALPYRALWLPIR